MDEQDKNELRAIYDELTALMRRLQAIDCNELSYDLKELQAKIPAILKSVE